VCLSCDAGHSWGAITQAMLLALQPRLNHGEYCTCLMISLPAVAICGCMLSMMAARPAGGSPENSMLSLMAVSEGAATAHAGRGGGSRQQQLVQIWALLPNMQHRLAALYLLTAFCCCGTGIDTQANSCRLPRVVRPPLECPAECELALQDCWGCWPMLLLW